ncbi:hypothetical protein FACS189425_02460 [Clostridia bacterium]|nr:hypothetical protein FACS189425_02460 [Clostridia bacterium]
MNIFLIGLPGCGKTTVGRKLAEVMKLPFIDIDECIETDSHMTISEIFSSFGESGFRERERKILHKYSKDSKAIISTGGGIVKTSGNIELMRERGTVVFLDRVPNEQNVDWTNRPARAPMDELVRERRPLYLASADLVFPLRCDFCVIGDPIGHTLSPVLHSAIFKSLGISATYGLSNVSRETLFIFTQLAKISDMRGFNVTIPHKASIIPLLDSISSDAQTCRAVNTVSVINGKLYGYNTDMDGLKMALMARREGVGYRGQRVLILGDGGAASGILYKARQDSAEITIASRKNGGIVDERVVIEVSNFDIIINATPLGMLGNNKNFADFEFLNHLPRHALVCDLIYNPLETALLIEAKKRNLAILNGLTMLISQAILADAIFFEGIEKA